MFKPPVSGKVVDWAPPSEVDSEKSEAGTAKDHPIAKTPNAT